MTEIKLADIMADPVIGKMKRYIELTNKKCRPDSAYSMRFDEICMLSRLARESVADAIILAFDYGRAKGERCAKARFSH